MSIESDNVYNDQFYAAQSGGSSTSAKYVVQFLDTFLPPISSVVDIGCGIGTWLEHWKTIGKEVTGLDFNKSSPENMKIKENEYIKHNLEETLPVIKNKYDLCMSLEVAEHLTEKRGKTFVNDLCSYSDIVLFGSAIPGQQGKNHINEQWQDYWVALFKKNDYVAFDIIRPTFWIHKHVTWWYAQNTILYINSQNQTLMKHMTEKMQNFSFPVLPLVHPLCLAAYSGEYSVSEYASRRDLVKMLIKRTFKR